MKLAQSCGILLTVTRRETSGKRLFCMAHPLIGHVQKAVHPLQPGIHLCLVSAANHPLRECVVLSTGDTRVLHLSLGMDRTRQYSDVAKPANLLHPNSVFSHERPNTGLERTSCYGFCRCTCAAVFGEESSQSLIVEQTHFPTSLTFSCICLTTVGIHHLIENEERKAYSPFFWGHPPFETSATLKEAYIIYQGE
ncbi:hypothetical protein MTO96_013986 [Rhipicephalus appendiculatus]